MSKIIDLVDGKVQISPECLVIEPFKTIWESDKNKEKVSATNIIKYIWFYTDFNSPYYQQNDSERHNLIVEYVILDNKFKVTEAVKKGIESYKKVITTPSMKLFEAVQESIAKMEEFFRGTDYTEENIDKIQKAILNMPKMQESVQNALENCRKEQSSGTRVRGDVSLGMFES